MGGWELVITMALASTLAGLAGLAIGLYWQRHCQRADQHIRHLLPPEEQEALLQGLQGLTLQIHAISEDLPAGGAAQTRLREVLASADHLLAWGDGSVTGHDHASDSQRGLSLAIAEIAREFNRRHPLSFHLMVQGARQKLTRQARDVIEQVSREAAAGACQAAHAQRLCVELLYLEAVLCIRIHDDGLDDMPTEDKVCENCAHYEPATVSTGEQGADGAGRCAPRWQQVEAMVRGLGGQLEVWARPHGGSELVVVIPASSAYETRDSHGVRRHIARWFASRQ